MKTRRQFLQRFFSQPDSGDDGQPVLVCVFLRGGADTLSVVVPYGDDAYYRLRPSIAIPAPGASDTTHASAIRLDDFYGLHPKMAPLVPLFAEGRCAVVQAVGSDNTSGSHFEAQDQMEYGEGAGARLNGGWIGRYLRATTSADATPFSAVAIGTVVPESLRGATAASVITSVDELRLTGPERALGETARALEALYASGGGSLSGPGTRALELLGRVEELRATPKAAPLAVDDSTFAAGLREVATLVKARVGLRVACIDLDGWDTHFLQGASEGLHAANVDALARGLAGFDAALAEERDRVIVVVMTEFGRRVYENSSAGTDHGRGFSMLVAGAGVRGGNVIGPWPGLEVDDGPLGPGGLRVEIDYRSVLSEVLAARGGLRDSAAVFPGFAPKPVGVAL